MHMAVAPLISTGLQPFCIITLPVPLVGPTGQKWKPPMAKKVDLKFYIK